MKIVVIVGGSEGIGTELARQLAVRVHNAGMWAHAAFGQPPDLAWTAQRMRINLWGGVWCTHAALPALKASRGQSQRDAVMSTKGKLGRRLKLVAPSKLDAMARATLNREAH